MASRNIYLKFLLIAALFFSAAAGLFAADGDLDPTFDGDGIVFTGNAADGETITDIIVQPDGKIIASGIRSDSTPIDKALIIRYNANGSIDTAFGTGGSILIPSFSIQESALQSDGKILFAGRIGEISVSDFYVARLNPDGSLDTTFNGTGTITLDLRGTMDFGSTVGIQPDGKILVGGASGRPGADFFDGAVVRINPNGSLDTAFDGDGKAFTLIGQSTGISKLLPQPDGKIFAACGTFIEDPPGSEPNPAFAAARYNSNGSLDTTFDGDGIAFTRFVPAGTFSGLLYNSVWSAGFQSDGKVIIAGSAGFCCAPFPFYQVALLRYNINGSLDPSFGIGGKALLSFSTFPETEAFDMAIQGDNKIVVSANIGHHKSANFAVARFTPNGTADTNFSGDGWNAIMNPFGIFSSGRAVAIQPNGKILIGGSKSTNGQDFMLARFEGSTRKATTDFDGDGKTDISIFRPSLGEWYYLRSSSNSFFGQQAGSATDKIVPADYTGDGKTDIAFFRPSDNTWYIIRSENQTFYAIPYAAPGDIPTPADFDGDGKADITIFRPSNSLWVSLRSSDGNSTIFAFGSNGDIPVPADYDGDGKADFTVYRPSAGEWYTWRSTTNTMFGAPFGAPGDKPVQGDYTGDGKADFAIFRPSTNYWYVLRSENQSFYGAPFASPGDIPVTGDYDGDGKNDFAVFRPSTGNWFILGSTSGFLAYQFGAATDKPVPAYYLP